MYVRSWYNDGHEHCDVCLGRVVAVFRRLGAAWGAKLSHMEELMDKHGLQNVRNGEGVALGPAIVAGETL